MKVKEYLSEMAYVLGGMVIDRDGDRISRAESLAIGYGTMQGIRIAMGALAEASVIDQDPCTGAAEVMGEMIIDFPDHRDELLGRTVSESKCAMVVKCDGDGRAASSRVVDIKSCPYAGRTARVSSGTLAGKRIEVEDWAYKVFDSFEWETMTDNPAVLVYLTEHDLETSTPEHPYYLTAVYGKVDGLAHIVRLEELEFDE